MWDLSNPLQSTRRHQRRRCRESPDIRLILDLDFTHQIHRVLSSNRSCCKLQPENALLEKSCPPERLCGDITTTSMCSQTSALHISRPLQTDSRQSTWVNPGSR